MYKISRQRIIEALEVLGLPPSACMNVLMEPDKMTVEMTVQGTETGRLAWKDAGESGEWRVLTADVVFHIVEDHPQKMIGEEEIFETTELREYPVKPGYLLDYEPGDRVYDPGDLPKPPAQVPLTPEEEDWIGPLIPEYLVADPEEFTNEWVRQEMEQQDKAVPEDLPDPDYWDVPEPSIPVGWPPGDGPENEEQANCEGCRFEAWEAYYADQDKRNESDSKPSYNQGGTLPLGMDEMG